MLCAGAGGEEVAGVLGSLLGEFVDGDSAEGGGGAEDTAEVAGLVVEELVLTEDEGVAADREAVGGVGLDEEAGEREVREELGEEAGGGLKKAAADAEPGIGALEERQGEEFVREVHAVKLPGADAIGPGLEEAQKERPDARAVEDDRAAEAGGEVELGEEGSALGGTAIVDAADAIQANFADGGVRVGGEDAFEALEPVGHRDGGVPGVEAVGGGGSERGGDLHRPLFGAGGAVDASGDTGVERVLDVASVEGEDARVAEVEMSVEESR